MGKPEIDWNPPKRPKVEKGRRQARQQQEHPDVTLLGPWMPVNIPYEAVESPRTSLPPGQQAFTSPQSYLVPESISATIPLPEPLPKVSEQTAYKPSERKPPEPTPDLLRDVDHVSAPTLTNSPCADLPLLF
jgi:hypothetical protein